MNPQVWAIVYQGQLLNQLGMAEEEGRDLTEEDIPDLDAFMAEQESKWAEQNQPSEERFQEALSGTRTMSGAKAPLDWREVQTHQQAAPLQWGPWQ